MSASPMCSPLIIGSLRALTPMIPAPMCGISDRAMRELAREMGCELVMTEMISAEGFRRRDRKTQNLIDAEGERAPVGVQLFGDNPEAFGESARILEDQGVALVDINAGCPARKVVGSNGGSALLKDLPLLGRILQAARAATSLPLTLKYRSGWDVDSLVYLDVARLAEGEGIDAVTLHPRTRAQGFSGHSNWEHIAEVKDAVRLPVIGNGDITSGADARAMVTQTGCDAVMIGRAYMGAPWILRAAIQALTTDAVDEVIDRPPSVAERLEMLMRHGRRMAERKGERRGVIESRKLVTGYLKGVRNSRPLRMSLMRVETLEGMEEQIEIHHPHLTDGL